MRTFLGMLILASWAMGAPELMVRTSFESADTAGWTRTWGPVKRSQERVHTSAWAIREELENKHGLSVWYLEFAAHPNAVYTGSAWVYVPAGSPDPMLSFGKLNWNTLAKASTKEKDTWVELKVTFRNVSEKRLRLQLFQASQQPGMGGKVMYWDDASLERELQPPKPDAGIRLNPYVREGLDVIPLGGMKIKVMPGKIDVDGKETVVAKETVLELPPPRTVQIRDEKRRLTDEVPRRYNKGTTLLGCRSHSIGLAGTLAPESLVLKAGPGPDGERFEEGTDWRADKLWGQVGRIPEGRIKADTNVYIDYDYSFMRIDTIEVRDDGTVHLRTGFEHKMVPEAPRVDMQSRALCNIFLPYHCRELTEASIYPIGPAFPEPGQLACEAKAALIPKTRAKLAAGKDLTIVYWGDSVTCGGDASSQQTAFPLAFTNWLRVKYPDARIHHVNAGTGGWNSRSKLPLFEEQVLAHKPDLVVIEFVNDMGFPRDLIFKNYTDAVGRIRAIGGEVIVLTPHFVRPDWMPGNKGMRTPETRETVTYLREFCAENKVGLADTSRRWEYLWVEGIPYLTLLYNGINHPDDRGHALFVNDLKLFFTAPVPESAERREFDMPPQK
jgi:lysophospholipase L1-like esterase